MSRELTAWAPAADNVGTGGGSTDWSALTGMPAAIDAIDNLTPAADRVAYYTGTNAAALAVVTGFARSLLDDADAATARGTLGAAAATHEATPVPTHAVTPASLTAAAVSPRAAVRDEPVRSSPSERETAVAPASPTPEAAPATQPVSDRAFGDLPSLQEDEAPVAEEPPEPAPAEAEPPGAPASEPVTDEQVAPSSPARNEEPVFAPSEAAPEEPHA